MPPFRSPSLPRGQPLLSLAGNDNVTTAGKILQETLGLRPERRQGSGSNIFKPKLHQGDHLDLDLSPNPNPNRDA